MLLLPLFYKRSVLRLSLNLLSAVAARRPTERELGLKLGSFLLISFLS